MRVCSMLVCELYFFRCMFRWVCRSCLSCVVVVHHVEESRCLNAHFLEGLSWNNKHSPSIGKRGCKRRLPFFCSIWSSTVYLWWRYGSLVVGHRVVAWLCALWSLVNALLLRPVRMASRRFSSLL